MLLTPEQLAALITWMTSEGWAPEMQTKVIAELTAADADDAPAPDVPGVLPATPDAAAAAEVMAARTAFVAACTSKKPALIATTQAAYTAALNKANKKPTSNQHPLFGLLAAAKAAKPKPTATPTTTLAAAPGANLSGLASIEAELVAQRSITNQLLMDKLDREGLLAGIEDPMELYTAAPDYFQKLVGKNISLLSSQSPVGSNRSGLREVRQAAGEPDDDEERVHREVTAYREKQVAAGRKTITYTQALQEWEQKNPPKKKALL